jgi:ribosomal protein S14
MMIYKFNTKVSFSDRTNRKQFSNNEIFYTTYSLLAQSKFSNKLDYFKFKSRKFNKFYTTLKNRCLLTQNTRNVYSKLKLSKLSFTTNVGKGYLTGFYRSM